MTKLVFGVNGTVYGTNPFFIVIMGLNIIKLGPHRPDVIIFRPLLIRRIGAEIVFLYVPDNVERCRSLKMV
jgi:hypothetical protein